jgi:hypothetical protein
MIINFNLYYFIHLKRTVINFYYNLLPNLFIKMLIINYKYFFVIV